MGQRLQVQVLSHAPGALAVPPRIAELKTARDAAQLQADLERATASGGELRLAGDFGRLRLEQFERPRWATAVGYDRYGVWADLSVGADATGRERSQRLRWIPSGEFWMGSPADEPGRRDDELLHQVRITGGYWLFDSACPQWLWESVMGSNPSRFRDVDRPVECVSWEDCQEFLGRLNELLGRGANFRLPSEAEWEYSCRAGTASALYTGGLTLVGEHNGPELDGIAWYGGNSGVDYDLEESVDGSDWREKQYEFRDCGSRRVKL
jgi:formylglycine-generating enzyme required for sulfatase activity